MAEKSSFFNDVAGDRPYDMQDFALYFKQFLQSGLYHRDNVPALRVTHAGNLQTKMDKGSAYLEGFMYVNDQEMTFTHDPADSTNARIDRIVIRLSLALNHRYIRAFIKKGTPATNPVPPVLTRNELTYEISLAQVRINANQTSITSVIDERLDPSVAGLVSSLISIPTEQFVAQWNSFMLSSEETRLEYQEAWEDWFQSRQNQVGIKVVTGRDEPTGISAGDLWLQTLEV